MLKKNKWLSVIFFSIPILVIAAPIFIFYYVFHNSTPESLSLKVNEHGQNSYSIEGNWIERADFYSYRKDAIVFCFPTKEGGVEVNLPNLAQDHDGMLDYVVGRLMNSKLNKNSNCQSFIVNLAKTYDFPYKLLHTDPKEVEAFYIHAVSEPMDSPTYWFKKLWN